METMKLIPKLYRGRWWWGGLSMWETDTYSGLVCEFFWLLRHGEFHTGWQWPELLFGVGRDWYDGPIWFAHFGFFSVDLSPR